MNIVIACGGTGGHLFPGLAVAETLRRRGHTVKLVVSDRAVEREALATWAGQTGHEFPEVQTISAVGLTGARRVVPFAYGLMKATAECALFYRDFAPEVVLGMGGYASAPAVLAARWTRPRRTTTLIHESNAVPGRANRLLGRFVHGVAVGWSACGEFFGGKPVTVTGTPLRNAVQQGQRVADAHAQLGLRPDRATVLVMGGSQGAHAINEGLACALPWLEGWSDKMQFLHLSGPADEKFMGEVYAKSGFTARVFGFCHQMDLAYSVADAVIARSGAATLAEIAAYGLPAVLVPYPHATGNHQWHNAQLFQDAGAARVYTQQELETHTHAERGERLAGALIDIFGKPGLRESMALAARALAQPDATARIADLVEANAKPCRRPAALAHTGRMELTKPATLKGA